MGSPLNSVIHLPAASEFGLHELKSASGLVAQLLPSGALFALRQGETLINQLLPGPAEDGLLRLLLRRLDETGAPLAWAPLAGPNTAFSFAGAAASWRSAPWAGLTCTTTLSLHPQHAAWAWRVELRNDSAPTLHLDLLHAQDLGIADAGSVRNNEAYVSQYIDLLPVRDESLGWVVLARQNQAMSGGRRPWAAFACAEGAAHFCTDGSQFFGADHRLTQEPAAVRAAHLPSQRLQYEFAVAGLQTPRIALAPGETRTFTFVGRFVADHPEISTPADVARVRELLPVTWTAAAAAALRAEPAAPFFASAEWFHAAEPTPHELERWFPEAHRHIERDGHGRVLSFFCGASTHVVTRAKEALVARPHGHILRSGTAQWIDDEQFGVTSYACGIFGAQVYVGNPSIARLLSVVRNSLNVARASGQRVFVRAPGGAWRQLGVPSAFAMEPDAVRWIYRDGESLLAARVWCSAKLPASYLSFDVLAGPELEFLVTHQLALGANEFEAAGEMTVHAADAWLELQPARGSLLGERWPETCFAVAAMDAASLREIGGAELLPGAAWNGPYAVLQTAAVARCGFALFGSHRGPASLAFGLLAVRDEFARGVAPARPPTSPIARLSAPADETALRVNEILPWFTHNAAIHFSAPHGLEQYGGAAWGVRDVTQGSIEWLLAAGEFAIARRTLATVFAQHYTGAAARAEGIEGAWPQWFMFPPFHTLQQAHSHGDVCFWPVKALCDYVEASNDFAFLDETIGYVDAKTFAPCGPAESLWAHCDRVVAHVESRFVPGTALVNYGDGDWDDTLQPADPTLRTRMISAWTVALAFQTFRQLAIVSRRAGHSARADRLEVLLARMRTDFAAQLMPGGTVAGFLVNESDGSKRPLLHPRDNVTGIRYRLLPMTRSMLAELFTPDEAARHAAIIERDLKFTDGVRLMSEPAAYHGGVERLFKRAETAANVGREIGLQYVHAHLRYAEAMAKLGEAEKLWHALLVVNPVALEQSVPGAVARQSNVYFSSSDADFTDRHEASARWAELRAGRVPVRGGWRLYSSGPGLYLHKLRACVLGVRESFGDVVFDPVLPRSLDGLTADTHLCGRPVRIIYTVRDRTSGPRTLRVNGRIVGVTRESNPYRVGGLRVPASVLAAQLDAASNSVHLEL